MPQSMLSIPVVVSSAGEAELASAFGNAKIAHDERTILRNLGYPQPPTPIFVIVSALLAWPMMHSVKSSPNPWTFGGIGCVIG
jgi:hypothetical protein